MDNNPDRNDNRIFYSKSRTGSVCTYETGRGAYGWGYFRKVNADKPFGWCGSFSRSSMLRVLCQISILYLLIPGYVIALILTRFVPKIFTAKANYGYNTQVMKAAQDGGAAGVTVLHGKGVGMKRPVLRVRQARSFSPFRSHLQQGSDLLKIFKI